MKLLLVDLILLLDGIEEDLTEADGRDVDIDGVALAAEAGNRVGVTAGENGDLAAADASALDAVEFGWKRGGRVREAEGDAAIVFADLLERHVDDGGAAVDHKDVVGDALDLGELVRGEEDGGAGGRRGDEGLQELFDRDGVEAFGGLVKDEERGTAREGEEESELGAHAFGEGFDFAAGRETVVDEELALDVGLPVGIERSREADELRDGHVAIETFVLADVGDAFADLEGFFGVVDAVTEDGAGAGGGRDHAEEHFDGGTFAGTIAAEEAGDALGTDMTVELVDGGEGAEAFGEGFSLNDALEHYLFLSV